MSVESIKVGIVGAGRNTRTKHLPALQALEGVEVTAVVNRTPESTAQVAEEFQIPRSFDCWQDLVQSDELDAVVVGTWPNLHAEVTIAALESGKHVLTEARMARNLEEARQMNRVARQHPDRIAQIVPSPYGLTCGPALERLIGEGFLGDFRELVVISVDDSFWDYTQPLHERQRQDISGINIHTLGILHETALRWTPPPRQVMAQSALFEPHRPLPEEGHIGDVTVPDNVQVLTKLDGGGRGLYHISCVNLFGPGKQIHLYGSRGTIKVQFLDTGEEVVSLGHAGDEALVKVEIPEEDRGRWRVEEDFIAAIQGKRRVRLNDFETALRYMEFTEAVNQSQKQGTVVHLPLEG